MMSALSGAHWVLQFPGSKNVECLAEPFRSRVVRFMAALRQSGARVKVTSTYRPTERAYLMHWAWQVAKGRVAPREVPEANGIPILWWHGSMSASARGACAMVEGYRIGHLKVAPKLRSHHAERQAIDMAIRWSGELELPSSEGLLHTIRCGPRNGSNRELIRLAADYGVIHYQDVERDIVHWSIDGF